jgi:dihydrofolate reductase
MELITALDIDGIIGLDNNLPWHVPEDLAFFKNMTQGHVVIMGRKTFESLPNGPLKNRINIVITRNSSHYKSTSRELHF